MRGHAHHLWFGLIALMTQLTVNGADPARAATISWTNPAGGAWSTPANWSTNSVPGAFDVAIIAEPGTYTVALDLDVTIAGLTLGGGSGTQTLQASGRALTLNGPGVSAASGGLSLSSSTIGGSGSLAKSGTLELTGSTLAAAVSNAGLLRVMGYYGGSAINGALTTAGGSTLRLEGFGSALTVANGFTNNCTI